MVKKTKRRLSSRPKSKLLTPQLPPSPVESSTEQSRGLVENISEGIKNLFASPSLQLQPETVAAVPLPSGSDSSTQSETGSGSLSAEQEAKLAVLPAVIGEDTAASLDAVQPGAALDEDEAGEIALKSRLRELADEGPVDEEMVGDLVEDLFDHLGERYKSDHWKLKPKQKTRLALPATACLNSCVQRVMEKLPDAVGESASAHPEWAALLLAVGAVAAPRVMKQMKLSKATEAAQKPTAAQPGPSGAVFP
jgi:hypothetical protein